MKKLLLIGVILLSGCGSDYMYDHNTDITDAFLNTKNNQDESEKPTKTWKDMGFSLEEFRIYSSANIPKMDALLWKQANISPSKTIKYYQEWKDQGLSNKDAVYFASKANTTPTQYNEVIQYLDSKHVELNKESIVEIIKNVNSGMTTDKAFSVFIYDQNKQREALQKQKRDRLVEKWTSRVLDLCQKIPQSIYYYTINSNTKNPYAFKGKCYILDTPKDTVKWLSDHQTLIIAMPQIDPSNIIYIYNDEPIKNDLIPIVIGTNPETFSNALGGENILPSFRIIGYLK